VIIQDTLAVLIVIIMFWLSGTCWQYFFKIDETEKLKNITAIYLGIFFYVLLFCLLGLMYKLTLSFLVATVLIFNVGFIIFYTRKVGIPRNFRGALRKWKKKRLLVFHLVAATLVYRNAVYPIDGFDALAYHLYAPYSALYHTHTFDASNLIPNSGLPLGTDAVYALLSIIGSPQTASIFNVFYTIAIFITVSKILDDRSLRIQVYALTSLFSLLLFLGPIFSEPGTDLPLIGISVLILSFYLKQGKNLSDPYCNQRNILIHLLFGLMIFTKPSVLIFVGVFWLTEICLSNSRKVKALQTCKVAPISLAPILVWFTKNFLQTGNPIIPFGTNIFKTTGYGSEVTTTESDIRSSFQQVLNVLTNVDSYKFILNFSSTQNSIVLLTLVFLGLVLMSVKFFVHGCRNSFLIAILLSEIITLLISGPIFRYFAYLFVMHFVLLIHISKDKKINSLTKKQHEKESTSALNDSRLILILFIVSVFGFLNITNTTWNIDRASSVVEMNGLSSGSGKADEIIFFVKDKVDANANVCLIGDSRAMLFWPLKISFLPANRINPFADPTISTNNQVGDRLKKLRCDFLVLTSAWGFPANVKTFMIRDFQASSKALISNEYYAVYDIVELYG
jgi:hypothetical protein